MLLYACKPIPAKMASWRCLVAALALIAFAFQSFLTQTHIHLSASRSLSSAQSAHTSKPTGEAASLFKKTPQRKAPADDDPAKCPLCQALGYAGLYVTPAAAALLVPAAAVSILPLAVQTSSAHEAVSHNWQGRGPPHF